MNIVDFKKRLKNIKPFIVMKFMGEQNCLAEEVDGELIPLSVSITPPSISFIMESEQITSLILRYSKSYKENADKLQSKPAKEKSKLHQKIAGELKKNILDSELEQAKQVGVLTRLGKEYLIAKSIACWHDNESDAISVIFTESKEAEDEYNEDADGKHIAIWVENVGDMELLNISMELISAIPTDQMPNIPIIDQSIKTLDKSTSTIALNQDGETIEGVTESVASVPADKVARFPRNIRNVAMENVSAPSG